MFETLIAEVLNKILGDFIQNIDAAQLNISVTSGKVKLENMKIKPSMFDSLPFPFSVAYGQIGLIDLTIPVWNMFNSPLIIEIKDIFAVIVPRPLSQWSEELEQKDFRESTQSQLAQFELFQQNVEPLAKKDPSSIDKLVNKIIDNVQITVKNVYIRYEDEFTAKNQGEGKFVLGILLKEFSAFTTDKDWKVEGLQIGSDVMYKVGQIKDFSVFLDYKDKYNLKAVDKKEEKLFNMSLLHDDKDRKLFREILALEFEDQNKDHVQHDYIIDKFCLETRAALNKTPITNKLPQLDVALLLGGGYEEQQSKQVSINFQVKQPQVIRVLKLIQYIGHYNEFQRGALAKYHHNKISKEYANHYVQVYLEWRGINEKKQQKEYQKKLQALSELEQPYSYSKLVILRKFGIKLLDQQQERLKNQKEYEKKLSAVKDSKKSGFFTSKEKKAQNEKEIEELKQRLEEEMKLKEGEQETEWKGELDQLNDDLEKENTIDEMDFYKMDENYVRFKFKLETPQLNLSFFNEYNQKIFLAQIQEQYTYTEIGINSIRAEFSLKSLVLEDKWTGVNAFPHIIETKELADENTANKDSLALYVKFESGKNISIAPFKLYIESQKTLFILVNSYFLKEVTRSSLQLANQFKPEDFHFYLESANEQAAAYMKKGRDIMEALEKGEFDHKNIDIKVLMRAPIILVPENVFQQNKPCMVLDSGVIKIESIRLQKYDQHADYKQVESPESIYDLYEVRLDELSVFLLPDGLTNGSSSYFNVHQQIKQKVILAEGALMADNQVQHILSDFSAKLSIFNCLEPLHKTFPTIEVVVEVEKVDITTCFSVLNGVLMIQNSIIDLWMAKEYQLVQKWSGADSAVGKSKYELEEDEFMKNVREKQQIDQRDFNVDNLDEDYFDSMTETLDEQATGKTQEVKIQDPQSIQHIESKIVEYPNFKLYLAIKKFQVTLLEEGKKGSNIPNEFLNVQMLHFNYEFELDRQKNIISNITIFKFIIQDMQKDSKMALPFRMLLSSPMNDSQLIANKAELEKKRQEQNEFQIEEINSQFYEEMFYPSEGTLIKKAILRQIEQGQEEEQKQSKPDFNHENELEITFKMIKDEIDITCMLTDMRLVFSMPTLQKMVKLSIDLEEMMEQLEDYRYQTRLSKLKTFEHVLSNLSSEFESEEEKLLQTIFSIEWFKSGLLIKTYQSQIKEGLLKLISLLDSDDDDSRDTEEEEYKGSEQVQEQVIKKVEKEKKVVDKIDIVAKLKNFSVWIPLNAEKPDSQILALSFQCDFTYHRDADTENTFDKEFNQRIHTLIIDKRDSALFTIDNLLVQNLIYIDHQQTLDQSVVHNAPLDQSGKYTYTNMLSPTKIKAIYMTKEQNQDDKEETYNKYEVQVEQLNIIVGYSQIDFANLMLVQIQKNINQQFEEKAKRLKEFYAKQATSFSHQKGPKEGANIEEIRKKQNIQKQTLSQMKQSQVVSKSQSKASSKTEIVFSFISLSVQLVDDSDFADHPLLIMRFTQEAPLMLNSYLTQDDAGSYILKKLGIYRNKIEEQMYALGQMSFNFTIEYYNTRTLAFEPLVEPWSQSIKIEQEYPYTEKRIALKSDQMFNVNLTYGMAITIRKIMDRIELSQKSAQRLEKLFNQQELTQEEEQEEKEFEDQQKVSVSKASIRITQKEITKDKSGYFFSNYLGLPLKFTTNDYQLNEELGFDVLYSEGIKDQALREKIQKANEMMKVKNPYMKDPKIIEMKEKNDNNQPIFISHEELYQIQKGIILKNNRGKEFVGMEEEPIKIDLKIRDIDKIRGIPIETLGTYSFATRSKRSLLVAQVTEGQKTVQPEKEKKKGGLLGFGLVKTENLPFGGKKKAKEEEKKEAQAQLEQFKVIEKKIGVVVDIQIEGQYRKISIESQLIIANNVSQALTIGAMGEHSQGIKLEQGQIFKVPIAWFISETPTHLYVQGANQQQQVIFKDLASLFTPCVSDSKLTQSHSQIIQLSSQYYASVDIQGYKCLPKNAENRPLRYIVSFNPPFIVTNNNFSNLEIEDQQTRETLIYLQPKYSSFLLIINRKHAMLNRLDPVNGRYNLQWRFYDAESAPLELITLQYHLNSRLGTARAQAFQVLQMGDKHQFAFIDFETKNQYYQNFSTFEGLNENFEFKQRTCAFVSSINLIVYPKFMLINKNSTPIQCIGTEQKEWQTILPYTNQYFNNQGKKQQIKFKAQGYKESNKFDYATIGLSGCFELEKEPVNQMQSSGAHPQDRVEYGIIIQAGDAPFNRTTLITIVPRYVIINKMKTPLVIRQKGLRTQFLVTGEQMAYNFQHAQDKFMVAREASQREIEAGKLEEEPVYADLPWSSPFAIEDIDDFQISFPGDPSTNGTQWYSPSETNNNMRFVRVLVTTQDDATILVIFSNPEWPEFEIQNKCQVPISFSQINSQKVNKEGKIKKLVKKRRIKEQDYVVVGSGEAKRMIEIKEKTSIPYTCQDRTQPVRKLIIKIQNGVEVINIDKVLKKRIIETQDQNKYCIEIKLTSYGKRLIAYKLKGKAIEKEENNHQAQYLQNLMKRRFGSQFKINFNIKGVGISIIDQQPREIMFLSMYKINVNLMRWYESRGEDAYGILENITNIKFNIRHLQLDNTLNFSLPIILAPSKVLNSTLKQPKKQDIVITSNEVTTNEYILVDEEAITPFIQMNVSFAKTIGGQSEAENVTERLRSFQFAIQEFQVALETAILINNIKFIEELTNVMIESNKKKGASQSQDTIERCHMASRQDYCSLLDAKTLTKQSDQQSMMAAADQKMFMEYIHLSAIRCIVTFRFEKEEIEFEISDPGKRRVKGMGFVEGLMSNVSSITDSPLSFKELIMVDTFISIDFLIQQLTKNYTRQGILQFYKLLGSSDMIGNPLGLVDKLGTGVFEFFSEPKNGLLQGPEEFVGGIGKGVKSLVTNVVGASFDSISKISGSLYCVVKSASGNKNVQLKKPDHVFDGIFQGVKGGMTELVYGVTGVFTKPVEMTKEEGVKGTFKGIGQGLVGLVSAPVTATLRLGSSVASGVSTSATSVGNSGKDIFQNTQYARFRPPRYINVKGILMPYNEELSVVYQVLTDIKDGEYASGTMKYFCTVPETKDSGELVNKNALDNALIILTDDHFLFVTIQQEGKCKGKANILFKTTLYKIQKCYLFAGKDGSSSLSESQMKERVSKIRIFKRMQQSSEKKRATMVANSLMGLEQQFFCLELYCRSMRIRDSKRVHKFISLEYEKFAKVFDIISLVPQCQAVDEIRQIIEEPECMFEELLEKQEKEKK